MLFPRTITLNIILLCLTMLAPKANAHVRHEVYLSNTEYELNIYRIYGEEPGKTIMIIGGIQGDEPGGYMTADLYADIDLKKGNLIVVPRANLYSILLNRRNGRTGDMNRKFGNENNHKRHLEEEVVAILKLLISESDCLLNLHEGSGFYSPTWINNLENPNRYGQSIIYDTATFVVPDNGRTIDLAGLARKVIKQVNRQIENKRYWFRPSNHDTQSEESLHHEQRKSATFYALTRAHIPAFGVETSKTIKSLKTKILLQKLVINTFMTEFGIILDSPGVSVEQPSLDYILIKVNNEHPVALPNGATLKLIPGDEITITDIIANYRRGVVADIEGMGTKNDINIPFRIASTARIIVRKDAQECGWVQILPLEPQATDRSGPDGPRKKITEADLKAEQLLINIEGEMKSINRNQVLKIVKGKRLILQGIKTNIPQMDNKVLVNFKGFAPPKAVNDGNDLNYPIYSDQDLWPRYSKNRQGKSYPVIATYKDRVIGEFWVELTEPK